MRTYTHTHIHTYTHIQSIHIYTQIYNKYICIHQPESGETEPGRRAAQFTAKKRESDNLKYSHEYENMWRNVQYINMYTPANEEERSQADVQHSSHSQENNEKTRTIHIYIYIYIYTHRYTHSSTHTYIYKYIINTYVYTNIQSIQMYNQYICVHKYVINTNVYSIHMYTQMYIQYICINLPERRNRARPTCSTIQRETKRKQNQYRVAKTHRMP